MSIWNVRKKKIKLNVAVQQQLAPSVAFVVTASDITETKGKFQDVSSQPQQRELGTAQLQTS